MKWRIKFILTNNPALSENNPPLCSHKDGLLANPYTPWWHRSTDRLLDHLLLRQRDVEFRTHHVAINAGVVRVLRELQLLLNCFNFHRHSCKKFLRLIENCCFTHFVSIRDFLFTLWAGRKFCQAWKQIFVALRSNSIVLIDNTKVRKIQMQNNSFPQLFSMNFHFNIWENFGRGSAAARQRGICKIHIRGTPSIILYIIIIYYNI